MSYINLYNLLADRSYYSLEINYASKKTGIPTRILRSKALSDKFERMYNDPLNVFSYNGVTYIGLETQRIRYDEDKETGTNWVEDAIARGEYD